MNDRIWNEAAILYFPPSWKSLACLGLLNIILRWFDKHKLNKFMWMEATRKQQWAKIRPKDGNLQNGCQGHHRWPSRWVTVLKWLFWSTESLCIMSWFYQKMHNSLTNMSYPAALFTQALAILYICMPSTWLISKNNEAFSFVYGATWIVADWCCRYLSYGIENAQ